MSKAIVRLTLALIIAGFGWLVFFYAYRYVWVLGMIKRDGSFVVSEPSLTMLNFELVLGYGTLAIIILATGYIAGKVIK